MTDFTARITEILREHVDRQLTNYDTEREECGCGQQGSATYDAHLTVLLAAAAEDHYRPRVDTAVDDLAGDLYENHYDGHEPPETRPLTRGDCRVIAERLADLGWARSPGAGE